MISGKIFVYPTDTIYGIGCNALKTSRVKKIREIKNRDAKPFSVIAPSKEWIRENCVIDSCGEKWLNKLPGAYTFIFELKEEAVSSAVIGKRDNLGIRIPNNWFASIIEETGIPFVTTSVNISGEKHIESVDELNENIFKEIDYVVDDGELRGNPSTVVLLINGEEKIIR